MKRTVKKFIISTIVIASIFIVIGCQKKQECDWCGKMKKCEEIKQGDMLMTVICDDCIESIMGSDYGK